MSRIIQIQNDFTAGAIDPKLRGRTDITQYKSGLTTAKNVSIQPQGGAKRRDGTKYITELDSVVNVGSVRMVPFEFSVSDSYMIVFTSAASSPGPSSGLMYIFKNRQQITGISGTVNGSIYTSTDAPSIPNLTEDIVAEMNWVQSADSLILVHEDLEPILIQRGLTDQKWNIENIQFDHIPKYAFTLNVDIPDYTITPSATSGNITLTASSVTTDTGTAQAGSLNTITLKAASAYSSDDQCNGLSLHITAGTGSGQHRHITDYVAATKVATVYPDFTVTPDNTSQYSVKAFGEDSPEEYIVAKNGFGRARITEFVNDTSVKALVEVPFFDTSAITSGNFEIEYGYEDAWSSSRGWPRSATFHEGRLFFGGSKQRPSTIWGSRVSDFFNFDAGEALDDASVEATLDTGTFNAIVDVYSGRHLQVFTTGGEFYVPQSLDTPITPSSLIVKQQTAFGIQSGVRVQNVDGSTIFVQRQGKSLQEFIYSDTVQAYTSVKISLLSSHLIKTPTDMAVRKSTSTDDGDRLLIVNGADGSIACYTLLRSQNVIAPSEWTTDGQFKAVAVDVDDIYVVTQRTKGGQDYYYVEVFDADTLLDCATTGTSGTTISVPQLQNKTVKIIRDGVVETDQTVPSPPSAVEITFATPATTSYQIGLNFTPEVKTLPVEPNLPSGSLKGFKKRIFEINADLFETQSLTIDGKLVPFRGFGTGVLDGAVQEYTGIKTLHGVLGYSYDGQITIGQDVPLKMNLLGIDYKVSVGQ